MRRHSLFRTPIAAYLVRSQDSHCGLGRSIQAASLWGCSTRTMHLSSRVSSLGLGICARHEPHLHYVRDARSLLVSAAASRTVPERQAVQTGTTSGPITLQRLTDLQQLAGISSDVTAEPVFTVRDAKRTAYVSRRRLDAADFDVDEVDAEGLPLVYNELKIAAFWKNKPRELAARWTSFAGISAPWLVALANAVLQGKLEQRQVALARDAVANLQRLGPTFIKLGQIMSIRPDVLPPPVMAELARLQDNLDTFDSGQARALVEAELGAPIATLFSEFSAQPVAAASLAQVYRARVAATGQEVAVKVQRPGALSTISKDLYVMRRAVGVYERLVKRFTAQTTDYQQLLSTFAEGLYTEMDFRNEALNAQRMQQLLSAAEYGRADEIVIPAPLMELTTRRVLTMDWVTGEKLTKLPAAEIRALVKTGQDAFLTQLLEIGFFHGDPHPGNLLKVTEGPNAGKLAMLDFGLVAEVPLPYREAMLSATIHLANRDWNALIDDFIALDFLPAGCDRGLIIPVMEKVLSPYLRGGGAKAFNFQMLSQDLLSATMEIPFSVPPYTALLARSVASLEGIALLGDPQYQMIAQAYPFVARKMLRNASSGAAVLLRDVVYDAEGKVQPLRLSALLNAALGHVADSAEGFVDLDAVPSQGASVQDMVAFLLSPEARDLRPLLVAELVSAADLLLRDRLRKAAAALPGLAPRLPLLGRLPLPPRPPVLVPGRGWMQVEAALQLLAPPLSQSEGVYLQSFLQLGAALLGAESLEPDLPALLQLLRSPSGQVKELQQALGAASKTQGGNMAVRGISRQVVEQLMERQAQRAGVPRQTLFPLYHATMRLAQSQGFI